MPYLDPIMERLLRLLNPTGEGAKQPKRYVQEQVITTLAEKRKNRSQRPRSELEDDKEDMALLEEIEDFALEDMDKCLYYLDTQSPLLVAVTSVKDMGFNQADSDDEEDKD